MKDIRRLFFTGVLLCIFAPFAKSQDSLNLNLLRPNQLKNFGKNAMIQGDYAAASLYFEKYLKVKPGNYKIAYNLADSYRLNRDYASALLWYEKSFELSNKEHDMSLYYMALMQKMNGNCDLAKQNFTAFKKRASGNEALKVYSRQTKNEIAGCDSLKEARNLLGKVIVTSLDSSVNKAHIESSPVYLNDSNIIYTSLRTDEKVYVTDSADIPKRKFHKASRLNGTWYYTGEMDAVFNAPEANVSSGSYSPDGKRFYFSRCDKNWKDKMICALYLSEFDGSSWSEPVKLNKYINNPKFSSTQPAVGWESVKGLEVVYFVTDREKGAGKNDIWYFTYNPKKKTYSVPRTAGNKINTPGNEMSPYYDMETKSLYFSSDGLPGIGGLDIFRSRGELKKFTPAENLTSPINSSYDDLFFTISRDRKSGMLTSNRKEANQKGKSTCCDDIYEFKRLEFIELKLKGNVKGGPDTLATIALKNSKIDIYVIDEREPEPILIKTVETDDKGNYEFSLEPGSTYKMISRSKGYLNGSNTVDTRNISTSEIIEKNFFNKEISKKPLRLENVYYETNKFELTPASRAALDTTLMVILTENPLIKIEIGSHTDDVGSDAYNQNLSQRRAEGVVKYLISKGIAKSRLVASGYGEKKPIEPNRNTDGSDNPEGREKNRRTEFTILGEIEQEVIIED